MNDLLVTKLKIDVLMNVLKLLVTYIVQFKPKMDAT